MARRGIRRSQAIVPFGVGSIVEFEDEALMPAGLDAWPENEPERLRDDRLAGRLRVDHFKAPPPRPDRNGVPGTMAPLPVVRFPTWHFCPRCRWLKQASLYDNRRPRCDNVETSPRIGNGKACGAFEEKKRRRMIPLRFVAVCEAGHIEDFPWNEWVHTEKGQDLARGIGCAPPTLYFYATKLGGLSGLLVKCSSCQRKRSLMGVTNPRALRGFGCSGSRPWLGGEGAEQCRPVDPRRAEFLAVQRGASNLYFPDVASSILIPPYSARAYRLLEDTRIQKTLESHRREGVIPEQVINVIAQSRGVDPVQLARVLQSQDSVRSRSHSDDETAFRFAEYEALHQERRDPDELLICREQPMRSYGEQIRDFFSYVGLIEKLAETRALTGFTRLKPGANPPAALSRRPLSWLPAFRVHGEGIFLELSPSRLGEFADAFEESRLQRALRSAAERHTAFELSTELVLLHTLAHLLIKRLSFEAGYGASSIRERIYSAPAGHRHRMSGILLYTAAGDADGTLGGLVGLGKAGKLERVLAGALEDARWCASDPICMESPGQGPGSLNIAACHACALLPETSCELQNRLLDRGVVNGMFGA